ncbi:exported hypothetical protein [Paraburkholderia tropica]|uniref:hypothetical protein n=1 Tax=Paraburkholderia tropica TaxID=92647 RepID=UPI001CB54D63|nr:hypothetical protein [Paraburkholderia tropica]CAG9235596.1 exported hypothetical protein [Paraburkholderia tropica]
MKKILLTILLAGIGTHANAAATANQDTHVCPDGQTKELAVLTYVYITSNFVNKVVCSGDVNTEVGVRDLIARVSKEVGSNNQSMALVNLIPLVNK